MSHWPSGLQASGIQDTWILFTYMTDMQHLLRSDVQHASELKPCFGQHGFELSRGLISGSAALPVSEPFSEIAFLSSKHGQRALPKIFWVEFVDREQSLKILPWLQKFEDATVEWAKGQIWWHIFTREMIRCLPFWRSSYSATTIVPSPLFTDMSERYST